VARLIVQELSDGLSKQFFVEKLAVRAATSARARLPTQRQTELAIEQE